MNYFASEPLILYNRGDEPMARVPEMAFAKIMLALEQFNIKLDVI